ncbi:MAG: TonB-dependent receptor [Candidatus Eisenbacteria bacterium]
MGRVRIDGKEGGRTRAARAVLSAFLVFGFAGGAKAGTTGKLTGFVVDFRERPIPSATVSVLGTSLWALTDGAGRYNILGVAPGKWRVEATRSGFQTMIVSEVLVSSDQSTWIDFELPSPEDVMKPVEIVAERPVVDVRLSSSHAILTSEEIDRLPVEQLDDVVNLQAGVVDGHFRGGRSGEVQWQVDGVSVNNAYDNKSTLRIDRSLLEEVQIISGTFDVEYGQAMSGVVNAVLKSGTREFRWEGEAYTGGYLFREGEGKRLTSDDFRPAAVENYRLTLSGPTGLPKTVYLLNGRRNLSDNFVTARRVFLPTDFNSPDSLIYRPTGDSAEVSLGYANTWSGALKITNSSLATLKLNYQAVGNEIEEIPADYAWRYNPVGRSTRKTTSISHGFDLTHTLGTTTLYNLSLRQNYFDYRDYVFEDPDDPGYDASGPPETDANYEEGAYIEGVSLDRFKQKTNAYLFKGSVQSQVRSDHLVKLGGEIQVANLEFGTPTHVVSTIDTITGDAVLYRYENDPPDYPGVQEYDPVIGAAYLQDQIEWNDLTLRAGLRVDYFDARSTLPSDLQNPANVIEGAPESVPVGTSVKVDAAPRLGVVMSVTDRAAVHFSYGHFYQYPPLGDIFRDADYSALANLAAGGIDYGVRGNPDIKAERTVQYEFGYKQALTDDIGMDISLFYKDIRDLLGVEFIQTYNVAEYARLANVDYGSVVGFTLAVDRRRVGLWDAAIDYTWQLARGNSSDPRETATRAEAGEDPRPRQVPLDWDQRHTLNLTVGLSKPEDFSVSAVLRAVSGQPYTPQRESFQFSFGLEDNSGNKPSTFLVDLRADKSVGGLGVNASLFARVFNLFDERFFNGFVFPTTGSPYYSRTPVTVEDPLRYYPPRRVELGISLGTFGG